MAWGRGTIGYEQKPRHGRSRRSRIMRRRAAASVNVNVAERVDFDEHDTASASAERVGRDTRCAATSSARAAGRRTEPPVATPR